MKPRDYPYPLEALKVVKSLLKILVRKQRDDSLNFFIPNSRLPRRKIFILIRRVDDADGADGQGR
jgi:hypothetical protein